MSSSQKKQTFIQKTRLSVPAFLLKTYEMIENLEYQGIVCWNSDGLSFVIKNITEFSDKVLANYFKHNNFASFVRQLNMYDFHKIRNENNETEFRHRLFQRGNKNLLIEIKRKSGENQPDEQSDQANQYSIELMEMERIKKDYNLFLSEVINIKQKYIEQERIMHQMASNIERIYSEKQALTQEFLKFKEEQEQKGEKFYYILSYFLMVSQENSSNCIPSFNESNTSTNDIKQFPSHHTNFPTRSHTPNQNNNINNQLNRNNNTESHQYSTNNLVNRLGQNNNNNNVMNDSSTDTNNIGNNFNNNNTNNSNNHSNNSKINANNISSSSSNNTNNNNNEENRYGQSQNFSKNQFGDSESALNVQNHNFELKLSKKQDWASVQQIKKDGEIISVCPLPYGQKQKEQNEICEKQITNLVNTFKNADLINFQKPDAFQNVLRDILSGKQMTVSEDAVYQFNKAKRIFHNNNTTSNSSRQNVSIFDNHPLKRICTNSNNVSIKLGITDGSLISQDLSYNSGSGCGLQLPTSMNQNQPNLLTPNQSGGNNNKQIQMQLAQNFTNNHSGQTGVTSVNNQNSNLFNQPYFNGNEVSPRVTFSIYPSPNPNSGQFNGNAFNNNFQISQQGLQNYLTSPSPNMSPLLLRDMEEFIMQQNINSQIQFGLTNQNHNSSTSQDNDKYAVINNGAKSIENNRKLVNDLLTSFKVESKSENNYC